MCVYIINNWLENLRERDLKILCTIYGKHETNVVSTNHERLEFLCALHKIHSCFTFPEFQLHFEQW